MKTCYSIVLKSLFIIFFVSISISCKNRKPKATAIEATPQNDAKTDSLQIRLVIAFISIGEGTDQEAIGKLNTYVDEFNRDHQVKAINYQMPWGREGEVDNCFKLENFTPDEQDKFITGVRELFKGNKLVQIQENQPDRFKQ